MVQSKLHTKPKGILGSQEFKLVIAPTADKNRSENSNNNMTKVFEKISIEPTREGKKTHLVDKMVITDFKYGDPNETEWDCESAYEEPKVPKGNIDRNLDANSMTVKFHSKKDVRNTHFRV